MIKEACLYCMVIEELNMWKVDIFVAIFMPSLKVQMSHDISYNTIFQKGFLAFLYFTTLSSPTLLNDFWCQWHSG